MKIAKNPMNSGILTWVGNDWENMWGKGDMFRREGVYISEMGESIVKITVWIYLEKNEEASWSLWTNPNNDPILEGNLKTTDFNKVVKHLNKSISKFFT